MIVVTDFDGTVARPKRDATSAPMNDATDLELVPGAREGLAALKRAGHVLVLSSCRANMGQRLDWRLDPLLVAGKVPFDEHRWRARRELNQRAYEEMIKFVERELPGMFDAVDTGMQGKPRGDLYLDDHGFRMGNRRAWADVAMLYGEPPAGDKLTRGAG